MLLGRIGVIAEAGARRRRGGAAPDTAFVTGFATTTNYVAGAAAGMAGSGACTLFLAFIQRASSQNGALAAKANNATTTTAGWAFRRSSAGSLEFRIRDGVGGKTAPTYSLGAGDVGKVTLVHGVIDTANNIIRMYRVGAQVGSGTATSGSFTASGNDLGIGSRNGGAESIGSDADIVGLGITDVVMSDAEIAAHYAACVAAQNVVLPTPGTTKRLWRASDFASPWLDAVASSSLTVTGAITAGALTPTVWA